MAGLPIDSDPKNLIVNYIPTPITDDDLRALFAKFGTIASARVIVDRITNHPKGYGFVKFTTEEAAKRAMKEMNGYELANKRLRVTQANGPQNRTIQSYSDRVVQLQPAVVSGGTPPAVAYTPMYQPQTYTMIGTGAPIYSSATTSGLPAMMLAPQQGTPAQPPMYYQSTSGSTPIIIEVDGKPMQLITNGAAVPQLFQQQYGIQANQHTPATVAPVNATIDYGAQAHARPNSAGACSPVAEAMNSAAHPLQQGGNHSVVRPLQFAAFTPGNYQTDPVMHSSFQLSVGTSSQMPSSASMDALKPVMTGAINQSGSNGAANGVGNIHYNTFMAPGFFS